MKLAWESTYGRPKRGLVVKGRGDSGNMRYTIIAARCRGEVHCYKNIKCRGKSQSLCGISQLHGGCHAGDAAIEYFRPHAAALTTPIDDLEVNTAEWIVDLIAQADKEERYACTSCLPGKRSLQSRLQKPV